MTDGVSVRAGVNCMGIRFSSFRPVLIGIKESAIDSFELMEEIAPPSPK